MEKTILHYDLDAFYASVETRDNKKFIGRPLVVAGGVVTTANYEARKYGVHSAMSLFEAKKLCPNLVVVPVDKRKYARESHIIHSLVLKITHKIEFVALDEGYIDVTDIILKYKSKESFAKIFRERIFKLTGLTCSIGIGINKLMAKIASDINKPNGQFIFNSEEEFIEYMKDKNIRKLQGVGEKFEKILKKDNINVVGDLLKFTFKELEAKYGTSRGKLLYLSSRGIDYGEVKFKRKAHSIGNESTYSFPLDKNSDAEINKKIFDIFETSYARLIKSNYLTKTISIKIRYENMKTISKAKTFIMPTDNKDYLLSILEEILDSIEFKGNIRLLGVSFKNLAKKSARQLSFTEIK